MYMILFVGETRESASAAIGALPSPE